MTDEIPAAAQVEAQAVEAPTEAPGNEQQQVTIPQVTIRLLKPVHPRTLPKRGKDESFDSITLLPQSHETVQELKLLVNDWVGGYWLGPYSLRVPAPKGAVNGDGPGAVLSKSKDGVEVRLGEKLSDYMEIGDVFAHVEGDGERVLEVVREPYSEVSARQTVLRLVDLLMPYGSTANNLSSPIALQPGSTVFEAVRDGKAISSSSETAYKEVEVAIPTGKKGKAGKKEVVKVKREVTADSSNPFADWTGKWRSADLAKIPFSQGQLEVSSCLKSITVSPFNPPPPQLRAIGHQLYLQIQILEGDIVTLICTSRGWYVSKSNVNTFDPTPRPHADGAVPPPMHSLIDLLHSLSPLFSERISQIPPISTTPPALEPMSTAAIIQAEPSYPWLATAPKPATTSEILRTQMAYLHTGATTADALDVTRDWNEEIQGVKEMPKESVQDRIMREKIAQKTWAEFTQASIRAVLNVARGDVPPLNPNEDSRGFMWLVSNIFITRAIDCIDTYAHIGGDDAAYISHAKDAAGVRILNKLDVDGIHVLGHTVVDWQGERWVCQSMLPGIFSRHKEEEEEEEEASEENTAAAAAEQDSEKKEDWVEIPEAGKSPSKSVASEEVVPAKEEKEEILENPLIIYGVDSEQVKTLHWDAATHKIMKKVGNAFRLAAHMVKDGKGEDKEFYASAEVKALRGTDGRRYMLDLPRLYPVDIEFQEKDLEGKLVDAEVDGPKYPHRVLLLRPELLGLFWESELKRWARAYASEQAKTEQDKKEVEKPGESSETKLDGEAEKADVSVEEGQTPAAEAAAAQRAEEDKPVDATLIGEKIKQFELSFNADAFVDQAPPRDAEDKSTFIPSTITDESDPTIKAVRDASIYLRSVVIPTIALDVLSGNMIGVIDGTVLSKTMHARGVNMRYLGYLASTIAKFSPNADGETKSGVMIGFNNIVQQEMVFRACKHILRKLIKGLQPEHIPCAISHFLNCLLGTSVQSSPNAVYEALGFESIDEPAYTSLTPESLRKEIIAQIQTRFRWNLDEEFLISGLRKRQFLRELATRTAFQLEQRNYQFERVDTDASTSEDDKEKPSSKDNNKQKKKTSPKPVSRIRQTTFEPSDILCLIPVVKSTAPAVTVAEEILDAGRNTINRGDMDLGIEFMLEGVQTYENIHAVLHPEVAAAYNTYASTIYQLARLKIQQLTAESADPEQPLGLDLGQAVRMQKQAVIIAERTIGVYHPETLGYYYQLAMLENLEGNPQQSLRYFRHVLTLWDVIHGPGHPEIINVLSSAGAVLQGINENALSMTMLQQSEKATREMFGSKHVQTAQALHQLTQVYFLHGDIPKALATSQEAYEIFKARVGDEHAQTKEVQRNYELLKTVVDNMEKQQAREKQMKDLKLAQSRLSISDRRRLAASAAASASASGAGVVVPSASAGGSGSGSGSGGAAVGGVNAAAGSSTAAAAAAAAETSRIGERGHLELDELVKFIQGQGQGSTPTKRGKNALRGKRRTGAKR